MVPREINRVIQDSHLAAALVPESGPLPPNATGITVKVEGLAVTASCEGLD